MSLSARNITKLYGKQKALDSVNFDIRSGEIVGFLGPNGAGKSTMMKIITGYIAPDKGTVKVNGTDIKQNILQVRKQTGYLPEHNPLYLEMYVKEYLRFAAKIFKTPDVAKRTAELIEMTGLQIEQNKKISQLSKGYRQRVGLAAALIHDPQVLILDEPTTGLDPNQIIEIRNLIKAAGQSKTVMLSTHIMQEVEAVCDRVIIINKGKIVADKPTSRIKENPQQSAQIVSLEFDKNPDLSSMQKSENILEIKKVSPSKFIIKGNGKEDIRPHIFRFAVNNGLILLALKQEEKTLEDVFIELTKKKQQ